jgi:hypothetical protein
MSSFSDKVIACKHEHLSEDYYEYISCGTDYCSGEEVHCLDCGAYITKCGCGAENDFSGWSIARRRHAKN